MIYHKNHGIEYKKSGLWNRSVQKGQDALATIFLIITGSEIEENVQINEYQLMFQASKKKMHA